MSTKPRKRTSFPIEVDGDDYQVTVNRLTIGERRRFAEEYARGAEARDEVFMELLQPAVTPDGEDHPAEWDDLDFEVSVMVYVGALQHFAQRLQRTVLAAVAAQSEQEEAVEAARQLVGQSESEQGTASG